MTAGRLVGRVARGCTVGVLGVALAAGVAPAGRVVACSSEMPTFDHVVAGAATIVDGRVLRVESVLSEPDDVVLVVDRVLKGESGPELRLDGPRTGLCGDGLDVPVGARVIVATDVPFFDQVITPYWTATGGDLYGTASAPLGSGSIEQLAASVAMRVESIDPPAVAPPDAPAMGDPVLGVEVPLLVAGAAVIVGLLLLVVAGRRGPRPRDDA